MSLFLSLLGPYLEGKTKVSSPCLLTTRINVDVDWEAQIWLLHSPNWNTAFRSLQHPTCIFSCVLEESSFFLGNCFSCFWIYFLGTSKSWIYYRSNMKNPKASDSLCFNFLRGIFLFAAVAGVFMALECHPVVERQGISQPAENLPPATGRSHVKIFLHWQHIISVPYW